MKKEINSKVSLIAYLIANGLSIPHYCYHNDLSIAGNCRVCLVELKNSMKPIVSCATNARAVIKNNNVYHDSALVKKARENILEFLLLNHPLDCPICDQGGDCDLQDQSLFFGFAKRRFYKFKRVVSDKELGPIVKTVMTRCIHCTRCVRFASEIAGTEELGTFGRGTTTEIGTYVDKVLTTELSGNVIDLCPVGALTLKSFPFELRGWDIEKFESIDPTDGFGSNTRVYVNKQQIIQIEPDYNESTSKTWLSDKGRQFFDGMFGAWGNQDERYKNLTLKRKVWQNTLKILFETLYLFEHCNNKTKKNYFLTIIFENLGIETVSLLTLLAQNYSFIKLRRAEKVNLANDKELNFQLNSATNPNQLKLSTLCLLVGVNPRYEGYYLNLDLRQRYLKGNFKCLVLGSLIDLTFPASFVGANFNNLKSIAEGNNLICQDFRNAKNPLLVFGDEISKRNDGEDIYKMVKMLRYSRLFNQTWNGLNTLSSSLTETGAQSINKFLPVATKDFDEFSSFYFINVDAQTVSNLKKITEAKLLNVSQINTLKQKINNQILDQNSYIDNNRTFLNQISEKYNYIPVKMFYENEQTFINTEGLVKKTNRLVNKKNSRDGWKLIRNFLKSLKSEFSSLNKKNNELIFFNSKKLSNFKIFINLHYLAIEKLSSTTFPLVTENKPFYSFKKYTSFRSKSLKLNNSKLKFWLDDFFTGGKDEYSKHSLILANCSKILRTQSTNFF